MTTGLLDRPARAHFALAALLAFASTAGAQDRLKTMPGYDRYQRMAPQIQTALGGRGGGGRGGAPATWSDDGKTIDFMQAGKAVRYEVATKRIVDQPPAAQQQAGGGRGRGGGGGPARGRQFESALSPDGRLRAIYRDRNIWVGDSSGANAVQITSDGSVPGRIKYGTASWVYGEELGQSTAMWW